jgi:hypothetical protein
VSLDELPTRYSCPAYTYKIMMEKGLPGGCWGGSGCRRIPVVE